MAKGEQLPMVRSSTLSKATSGCKNSDLLAGVNPLGQERGEFVQGRREWAEEAVGAVEYEDMASGSVEEIEEEGEREYDEVRERGARRNVKLVRNKAYGVEVTS